MDKIQFNLSPHSFQHCPHNSRLQWLILLAIWVFKFLTCLFLLYSQLYDAKLYCLEIGHKGKWQKIQTKFWILALRNHQLHCWNHRCLRKSSFIQKTISQNAVEVVIQIIIAGLNFLIFSIALTFDTVQPSVELLSTLKWYFRASQGR